MDRMKLSRHAAAAAMAVSLLWTAACAGPGPVARTFDPAPGGPAGTSGEAIRPGSDAAQQAQGPTSGESRTVLDPLAWGNVSFKVKWPGGDRSVAYIHPDTNLIEIKGFTSGGADLLNSEGSRVQGSLDKNNTTLVLTNIPSGSARFEAVAKNTFGTTLATGSVKVQVEGNASTAAKLVLGLPGEPVITSFSPTSGIPGYTAVDISGANFDTTVPGFSVQQAVKVGDTGATSVSARTTDKVTFTVPVGASNGTLSFTWTAQGVSRTATSSTPFRVVKAIAVSGDGAISVASGSVVSFSASATDTDDESVGDAEIPWTLANPSCTSCAGSFAFVGQLATTTGATNSFTAQNTGTITLQAGAGSAVGTVSITVTGE